MNTTSGGPGTPANSTQPGQDPRYSIQPNTPARHPAEPTGRAVPGPPDAHGTPVTTAPHQRIHLPIRPIWLCRICTAPWPCEEARRYLLRDFGTDRVALALYLATTMADAIDDLYTLNPHQAPPIPVLWDRFMSLIPPSARRGP